MPRTNSLKMAKQQKKVHLRKKPSCKEHSYCMGRGTAEGYCIKHRNPRERHHDKVKRSERI